MDAGYEVLQITQADLKEAEIRETWQMYRVLTGAEKHKHFGLVRLNPDAPAATITKDAGNTTTGMIHPFEIRKLTIPEIKRLASFPDDFAMLGDFKNKWARIGNSVPPLFMRSILVQKLRKLMTI
jgi:site-specific DNA-cytosine methylase